MRDYQNLLEETKEILAENGKTIADIQWFGSRAVALECDMSAFLNVVYDSGYGANVVPLELILVGADFWLERAEYDGSEWWEFKTYPPYPNTVIKEEGSANFLEFRRLQ